MKLDAKHINPLVEYVKIDRYYVSCHFKCDIKNKTVVSTVAFEPYEGKLQLTLGDIIFHPIRSYNRYYHTPITIFAKDTQETIVLKAFNRVSNYFVWNQHLGKYVYN